MNCYFCGLNLVPTEHNPTAMRCPDTKCKGYGFAIKEPMNEPKSQTPLTDALDKDLQRDIASMQLQRAKLYEIVQHAMCSYDKHARSLELKLQEAERQRDEARLQAQQGNETVYRWRKLVSDAEAERDQLIKVVDALAKAGLCNCIEHGGIGCDECVSAYHDHSLLPHVQAKKGQAE